ncbi:MAG: hypothetical protein AABZ08_06985 [Planctomycetota bacterium]
MHKNGPTVRPLTAEDFDRASDAAIGAIFEGMSLIHCAMTEPESSNHAGETIQVFRLAATIESFCAWLDNHRGLMDHVQPYLLSVADKPVSHDGLTYPTVHRFAWAFVHRLWLTVKNIVDAKSVVATGRFADSYSGSFRLDRAALDKHWEPIRDALKVRQAPDSQNFQAMIQIESAKALAQWRDDSQLLVQKRQKRNGKGGRPKLSARDEKDRVKLIAAWQKAKEASTSQRQFCSDKEIDPQRLTCCINWAATRKRRDNDKD